MNDLICRNTGAAHTGVDGLLIFKGHEEVYRDVGVYLVEVGRHQYG